MRYFWISIWLLLGSFQGQAQMPEPFQVEIGEAFTIPGAPGIHAYAYGIHEGKWVIMGGKITGLHDHRPPFSFAANTANRSIWVIDPALKQVWSAPVSSLEAGIGTQLGCTNLQFYQEDSVLYLIGGYGWDSLAQNIFTHSRLTAVNLPSLVDAVIQGNADLKPFFRQISDARMAVTGGHLAKLGDTYYLVWGQRFDGRYNPHNMPSFTQEYTHEIRKFKILDDGQNLAIDEYSVMRDTSNFRRRDYNLVPQVFAGNRLGLTGFTGVFQKEIDLPHLDVVEIDNNGYRVRTDFEQLLNQYHSAFLPVYDSVADAMHTFFFGGIAQYYYGDPNQTFYVDSLVPFVKTISQVSRFANDSMAEYNSSIEMPGYLGSSTELILSPDAPTYREGIIDLNSLASGRHLLGYIYGGIEANGPYVFMFRGSSKAYEGIIPVYIRKSASTGLQDRIHGNDAFACYPNPTTGELTLYYELLSVSMADIQMHDLQGKLVAHWSFPYRPPGNYEERKNVGDLSPGIYTLSLETTEGRSTLKLVVEE